MPTGQALQEHPQRQGSSAIFHGNVSVIAISSATQSLGGFVGIYLPKYFVQIGGDPLTLGLFTSASSLIQFFTLSIGGFLADYYGRRKAIVFAAFYSVFFPLLYAIVQDWRVFGVLTVLSTVGTIASPSVHAIVADSVPPHRRTLGITNLQVVSSLPSVMAPLIGGGLIANYGLENGFQMACIYATILAVISAIPIIVFLKETLQRKTVDKPNFSLQTMLFGYTRFSVGTLPSSLKVLIISYALVAFANGMVARYYILFASDEIGLTALDWGIIVSLQFLLAIALKIPGGWLSDKFGKRKVMIISLLITAPTIVLFALSQSFIQVMFAALLLVAAGIYFTPTYEALQADLTPRAMRGRITALWDIGNAVSAALGALVGGFMFQAVSPAAPFYFFALTELAAALLLIKMVREPETKED